MKFMAAARTFPRETMQVYPHSHLQLCKTIHTSSLGRHKTAFPFDYKRINYCLVAKIHVRDFGEQTFMHDFNISLSLSLSLFRARAHARTHARTHTHTYTHTHARARKGIADLNSKGLTRVLTTCRCRTSPQNS